MSSRRLPLALALAALFSVGCQDKRMEPWVDAPSPYGADPTQPFPLGGERSDVLERDRVGSTGSDVYLFGVVHLSLLAMMGLAAFWWRKHQAQATLEHSFDPRAPLRDGPAAVMGVVETDPGPEAPAVAVTIYQRGTEAQNKGQWSHTWSEVKREVWARPFWIRRDDGAVVRVEPDQSVVLRDDLSRLQRYGVDTRTRHAELQRGERVFATGALSGAALAQPNAAYRGMQGSPTLRAAPGAPLMVSTEPPGDTFSKRALFHLKWLVALVVVGGTLAMTVFPKVELLTVDGVSVMARPTQTRHWMVWVKPKNRRGYWSPRYAVRAEYTFRDGQTVTLEDECGYGLHRCVTDGQCARVPFVVSAHMPSVHMLGSRPSLTVGRSLILGITLLILGIAYPVSAASTRPWYLRKRVNDHGRGRL
ncbi:MAG: hypothetical protein R3A52_15270 [Polyangiales bacterium]